jgi:hypothetical protein
MKKFHLVRHGISTHTPTWHANCRRNIISSPPRGMTIDEILTYRYVKPWVHWFPNKEDPPRPTPSGSPRGSGAMSNGHARAHPLAKRSSQAWLNCSLRLGLGGLPEPWAPDLRHLQARPLAPARLMMPAKARAQEDKPQATDAWGLLGVTPKACPYKLLLRQGHVRDVTQEDKASHGLRGLGGFWAHASAPGTNLLRHQEDSRRERLVQANTV